LSVFRPQDWQSFLNDFSGGVSSGLGRSRRENTAEGDSENEESYEGEQSALNGVGGIVVDGHFQIDAELAPRELVKDTLLTPRTSLSPPLLALTAVPWDGFVRHSD
jgi:hypothetical protein